MDLSNTQYEKIIDELPIKTILFLKQAIRIFSKLEKQPIKTEYSEKDKVVASMLLSLLEGDSTLKKELEKEGITKQNIFHFMGIEEDEKLVKLSEEEYKNYYENRYQKIIYHILSISKEELKKLEIEEIIEGLYYHSLCGSKFFSLLIRQYSSTMKINRIIVENLANMQKSRQYKKKDQISIEINLDKYINKEDKVIKEDKKDQKSENNIIKKEKKENKMLNQYGIDLTKISNRFKKAVGREKEIEKMMVGLIAGSVLLIGEPGVGKTALVEGLAYFLQQERVPNILKGKTIIELNTQSLVAGCSYVGQFEKRMKSILDEVVKDPDIILFIDEIHTIVGLGCGTESSLDLANMIKPYLARGQIKLIGATTEEEYQKYMQDGAIRRRFTKVQVNEPEEKVVYQIMEEKIKELEQIAKVKCTFTESDRKKIFHILLEVTNKRNRNYKDIEENPSLALSILSNAFFYSAIHGNEQLQKEDISSAILDCDRLYESVRQRYAKKLISQLNQPEDQGKNSKKIIQFRKDLIISDH